MTTPICPSTAHAKARELAKQADIYLSSGCSGRLCGVATRRDPPTATVPATRTWT